MTGAMKNGRFKRVWEHLRGWVKKKYRNMRKDQQCKTDSKHTTPKREGLGEEEERNLWKRWRK